MDIMKTIMRERVRDLKREMVLEKASVSFEKEGFDATTMSDIARSCGISIGALYTLFGSKEELFYAYVEDQIERLYRRILERSAHLTSPREKLQVVVEQKFETFCEKSRIVLDPVAGDPLFFTKISLNRKNPAQKLYDYTAGLFRELERQMPLKGGDAMQTSYLFHQYLLGYVEYWLQFGGTLREESAQALERFLHGMVRS